MCVCMYVCLFVCVRACVRAFVCLYIYIYIYIYFMALVNLICIHTHIHTCIHAYMHTQKYIHTYIQAKNHTFSNNAASHALEKTNLHVHILGPRPDHCTHSEFDHYEFDQTASSSGFDHVDIVAAVLHARVTYCRVVAQVKLRRPCEEEYLCVCVYVCIYVCMYVCMHACLYASVYLFMYSSVE
jgi:hypothetical protein